MDQVTAYIPRARRSARRQALITYVVAVVGALLGLVALVAPTGSAAVATLAVAAVLLVVAGVLWTIEVRASRTQPLAAVRELAPRGAQGAAPGPRQLAHR
jgi:uncharacterized membrane protein HdeD (DUF308 family)